MESKRKPQKVMSWVLTLVLLLSSFVPTTNAFAKEEESFQGVIWRMVEMNLHKITDNNVETMMFRLKNKLTGEEKKGYCLDFDVPAQYTDYHSYPVDDLNHLEHPFNFAKIKTIMHYGFNGKNLQEINAAIGENLTEPEAVRATQLALWSITAKKYEVEVRNNARNKLRLYNRGDSKIETHFGRTEDEDARVYKLYDYLMKKENLPTSTKLPVNMKIDNLKVDLSGATPVLVYDIVLNGEGVKQLNKINATVQEGNNAINSGTSEFTSLKEGTINVKVTLNGYTKETVQNKVFKVKLSSLQTFEDYLGMRYLTAEGISNPMGAQTIIIAEKIEGKEKIKASAEIEVKPIEKEVTFSKVAAGQGKELEGAKITVSGKDVSGAAFTETWTSGGNAKVLKLKAGEYKMVEDQAPLGYDKASEIVFKVNLDGSVQIKQDGKWVEAKDAKIQMVDKLTEREVTFSKIAAGQGKELEGAKITVSGKDVNGVAFTETWTSGGNAKVLKLKAGEYKMVEDQAPLGYNKASEIVFRVNLDGSVQIKQDGKWVNASEAKIQMVDELEKRGVKFSKVAAGQGSELAGAKLIVSRADGTEIAKWISGGDAKVLELEAGEYKMVEDQAPLGYDKASEIVFRVNLDGSVQIKQDGKWVNA